MEWALVGVLNVSLALEDPFDNLGMDGIFIDEQLFEVQQVLEGDYGTLIQEPIAGVPGRPPRPRSRAATPTATLTMPKK